jgi:hypothetical protein
MAVLLAHLKLTRENIENRKNFYFVSECYVLSGDNDSHVDYILNPSRRLGAIHPQPGIRWRAGPDEICI